MITTVTLNAAIDKTYRIGALAPHAVMRVRECIATAGGKGLNVARVASAAGGSVTATGFLGGFTGQQVRSLLAGSGIRDAFLTVPGETRTCINVWEDDGGSTEFLEPGLTLTPADIDAFTRHFEATIADSAIVTLSGSMPEGCPADYYQTLVAAAHRAGKQVLLDASGERLRLGLAAKPTLVKPNRDELAALLGRPVAKASAAEAALALHRQGIGYVVVSLGADGALLACADGVYTAAAPDVPVRNTVGCGDSMVAALALALERALPPPEMLAYAVEVSTASAMHPQTGGFDPADYEAVRGQAVVRAVS